MQMKTPYCSEAGETKTSAIVAVRQQTGGIGHFMTYTAGLSALSWADFLPRPLHPPTTKTGRVFDYGLETLMLT